VARDGIDFDQELGKNWTRVARFYLVQHTKTGKNIPNHHKIYHVPEKYIDQMYIKYTNVFHCKTPKIYPKIVFFVWQP
jgi:hypothetical protein